MGELRMCSYFTSDAGAFRDLDDEVQTDGVSNFFFLVYADLQQV